MSELSATIQSARPGALIALFRLDVSPLGGQVMYFCQAAKNNAPVTFGGIVYQPVDVEFSGMEVNAGGALPRPHIKVPNTNGVFQQIINQYGDLLGVELRRVRTFARYLDGAPDADPGKYFGPDAFRVERKVKESPIYIEWELSANIDNEGKQLPGRQCIRDTCMWRYRQFNANTGDFDYSRAQCPYAGTLYFDRNNNPVASPADDRCSRHLTGCEARFGTTEALPFGGFPGLGRSQ